VAADHGFEPRRPTLGRGPVSGKRQPSDESSSTSVTVASPIFAGDRFDDFWPDSTRESFTVFWTTRLNWQKSPTFTPELAPTLRSSELRSRPATMGPEIFDLCVGNLPCFCRPSCWGPRRSTGLVHCLAEDVRAPKFRAASCQSARLPPPPHLRPRPTRTPCFPLAREFRHFLSAPP